MSHCSISFAPLCNCVLHYEKMDTLSACTYCIFFGRVYVPVFLFCFYNYIFFLLK